ncbi:hypothetical protein [Absidia glauca]|uniref:Uncharacterized protein n=1 Tax=Absidia glauca TaxID=4829 RepID=A0A163IQ35_ABSGL|nr:hypothetical protein [Absidia glauca]
MKVRYSIARVWFGIAEIGVIAEVATAGTNGNPDGNPDVLTNAKYPPSVSSVSRDDRGIDDDENDDSTDDERNGSDDDDDDGDEYDEAIADMNDPLFSSTDTTE